MLRMFLIFAWNNFRSIGYIGNRGRRCSSSERNPKGILQCNHQERSAMSTHLFSISASIRQIQRSGSQMENEGTSVTYTIHSLGFAPSGIYEIGLSSGLYPSDIIFAYGIYVNLQVGNTPNTVVMSSCHNIPATETNPGLPYSEVVGITNSSS